MTAITNLMARTAYKGNPSGLPICILMHGWSDDALVFGDDMLSRFANYGLFVAAVGLRGRNSSDGSRDASGREIYDIIDAINYIRANYASIVDAEKVCIVGYSGGGGNALAAACKMPDMFNVVVDFFGMSDYGRDATNGWYYNNNGTHTAGIVSSVGGTPAEVPNNYYARDATAAITNFTGGYLYMYHKATDASVPLAHSARIKNTLDGAGMTNYSYNISDLYEHGYPAGNANLISPEAIFLRDAIIRPAWTIEAAGTKKVIGSMETKRFSIRLNANGTALFGLDAAASVVYNTATDTYVVTPLTTGGIDVAITQGTKTGSATNISTETVITVT